MPTPKMPNSEPTQELAKKTIMEKASNITSNSSMVTTPSSMKKKTTIFPKRRVVPMEKKKCQVAATPPNIKITTSDEELLLVTKMIEAQEVAKKIKKIQEDEEVQGRDRANVVRGKNHGG